MSALALLGLVSATHAQARADVVNAPPEDCAPGAVGRTGHSGQWCAPTTCTTDADCTPANIGYQRGEHRYACRDAALCVQDETYVPGGRHPDRTPRTRPIARGACPGGGACAAPTRCERAQRCVDVTSATTASGPAWPPTPVPGPSTPGATPPAGTSARPCCAATPWATERTGSAAGATLGAILCFAAITRRRRRRPPPLG